MDSPAAPIDESVLETLYQRAETHPLTQTVQGDRTGRTLTQLTVLFDTDQYPAHIHTARLEIQWYQNEDYLKQRESPAVHGCLLPIIQRQNLKITK